MPWIPKIGLIVVLQASLIKINMPKQIIIINYTKSWRLFIQASFDVIWDFNDWL